MSQFSDLETMIEILGLTIARQASEEEFFRRSAEASSSEVAKSLFTEIADTLGNYCRDLEQRRRKLLEALEDLKSAQ